MRNAFVISAAFLLMPGLVTAQKLEPCKEAESIDGCWNRLWFQLRAGSPEERQQGEPVGGVDPGVRATIKDFLPQFTTGFSIPTGEKGANALVGEYNLSARALLSGRLKLRFELNDPRPYKPLLEAVAKNQREAASKELQDGYRDIDDLKGSVAWNLESISWGRSLRSHRAFALGVLQSLKVQTIAKASVANGPAVELSNPTAPSTVLEEIAGLIRDFPRNLEPDESNKPECQEEPRPLRCAREDFRTRVRGTVEIAARAAAARDIAFFRAIESSGYGMIPYLINNQPQFHATLEYRHPKRTVGPRYVKLQGGLEIQGSNMNELYSFCRDARVTDREATDAQCLQRFVEKDSVTSSLRSAMRFALGAAVTHGFALDVALPTYAATLHEPAGNEYVFTAAVGRFLGVPETGAVNASGRVDTSIELIQHSKDPNREKTRLVLTGSYTHRVSEGFSVMAGLTVANKSEFLSGVDWPVGAHAGFKYKLISHDK